MNPATDSIATLLDPFAASVRSAALARIRARLDAANGPRRTRTVTLAEVLGCLRLVADGREFFTCDGGSVASAYSYPAITTLVLAARVEGRIYLGIATADAKATSPGRAWSCLQPWRHGSGPAGDAAAKWIAWTACGGVLELPGAEVDAILLGDD